MLYIAKAQTHAMTVLYSAEATAHFQPLSEPMAAIVAMHGRYNSVKTKSAKADGIEKSPLSANLLCSCEVFTSTLLFVFEITPLSSE